jgi:hypothetical protein
VRDHLPGVPSLAADKTILVSTHCDDGDMAVPEFPAAAEDVSQGIRAEVTRVMCGLMYQSGPLARPESPKRTIPVTSRQWWSAYGDSCLELVCLQLDDAAADLLEIRCVPVPVVQKRLPGLVAALVSTYRCLKDIEGDLGQFNPPESDAGPAGLVCEVAQACYAFTAAILECAVGGLDTDAWTSAVDARRRRDRLLGSINPPSRDLQKETEPSEDPVFERMLGLPTSALSDGDGLTFASRVAAAWGKYPELDDRLRTQLPHLLDPATPLRDKVRMHLTQLLGSARPLGAHQAAVAARDLVLRVLSSDRASAVRIIADGASQEPIMYATHQCLISAVHAYNQASSPHDRMRPALQMYNPVMEGDVRRVARLALKLLGRKVTNNTTLTPLAEQLIAISDEPICILLSSCIETTWRNAIAHEQVWWDSARQRVMLAGEAVDPAEIAGEALRAHEICRGFETGLAVALNQAGNPQDGEESDRTETASSIRLLLALGEAGITASRLDRDGITIRPLIAPLTIRTLDYLHQAVIQIAAEPETMDWDIRQTAKRPPYRISRASIEAALSLSKRDGTGQLCIELPIAALPMVLSGLAVHEPNSASIVPTVISLAAIQITGEYRRLAPQFAVGDPQAHASLQQTMRRAAQAIEASATIAVENSRQELLAFSRLVRKTLRALAADGSANADAMQAIELALRSCGSPQLPWLEDIPS